MAAHTLDPNGAPASEQIRVRLPIAQKRKIKRAAQKLKVHVAEFARQAMEDKADLVLAQEEA